MMKKMFPCKVTEAQRPGILVLDITFETPNEEILNGPLLGLFLKYVGISSKYGGVIYTPDETTMFPIQPGKMYMRFSLIFPSKEQLREYVRIVDNLRPDNCF